MLGNDRQPKTLFREWAKKPVDDPRDMKGTDSHPAGLAPHSRFSTALVVGSSGDWTAARRHSTSDLDLAILQIIHMCCELRGKPRGFLMDLF
jgi:hypothetical protein